MKKMYVGASALIVLSAAAAQAGVIDLGTWSGATTYQVNAGTTPTTLEDRVQNFGNHYSFTNWNYGVNGRVTYSFTSATAISAVTIDIDTYIWYGGSGYAGSYPWYGTDSSGEIDFVVNPGTGDITQVVLQSADVRAGNTVGGPLGPVTFTFATPTHSVDISIVKINTHSSDPDNPVNGGPLDVYESATDGTPWVFTGVTVPEASALSLLGGGSLLGLRRRRSR